MFIVGIDIAKRSHEAVVINDLGEVVRKSFNFKNSITGFNYLVNELNKISKFKDDFIIAMESTSHYWLPIYSSLMKNNYNTKVINPLQSDALRNLYIRQTKNDAIDSLIIAQVIRFGHYSEGVLQATEFYELRELARARYYIVDMCSDIKKKVICLLDQVFPEYETLFSNMFGLTSLEILKNYPLPSDLLSLSTKKLLNIVSKPSNNRFKLDKVNQIQLAAENTFGITVGCDTMKLIIQQHALHIEFMQKQIADLEEKIISIYNNFNCYLHTIPGVGILSAAMILSEIGDISRFSSASKLAAFAGIDPTVKQSGEFNATHNHMSKRGSPYLRRTIWHSSTLVAMHEPNIKAFFESKRLQGKRYMCAIGHVTKKLNNIIFAILRDKQPYYLRE